jgi:hypothetical protein
MRSCRKHLPIALFMLVSAYAPTLFAQSACPGGGAVGTITVTEKRIEPGQSSNVSVLKAEQRCTLVKDKGADDWDVNLIAHLKGVTGTDQVNLVFYDQASGKPEKPGNEVNSFPVKTKKDTKVVIAAVEINTDAGFKPGGKYSVLITKLVNDREEVLARTTLELK